MAVQRDDKMTNLVELWREDNLRSVCTVLGCGLEARSRAEIKENSKKLSSMIATVRKGLLSIDLEHPSASCSKSSEKSWRMAKGNAEAQTQYYCCKP